MALRGPDTAQMRGPTLRLSVLLNGVLAFLIAFAIISSHG